MEPQEKKRAQRRVLQGVVVSTKSSKTIVVSVERKFMHSFYKKHVVLHKKFHAHDEKEKANEGDQVRIISCRPLSAKKRWRLLEVVKAIR